MAATSVLEGGRRGLAWVPRPRLDVATLHGERIALIAAAAAADNSEETDHRDDGVGVPYKQGVRRGARWVTALAVIIRTSSPRWEIA